MNDSISNSKDDKLTEKETIEIIHLMIEAAQIRGYDGKGMGSALHEIEKGWILKRRYVNL